MPDQTSDSINSNTEEEEFNSQSNSHSSIDSKALAKDQHYRLNGRTPLKTILYLSFGPVISQLSTSLFGIIDTMWISRCLGPQAMASIATFTSFDNIGRSIGFFLLVSGSSQISFLYGSGNDDEASQVLCDLLRLSFPFAAIIPGILIPCAKMAARWFGAPEDTINMGFPYITITVGCSIANAMYQACGGFLQGEGRTLLFGLTNLGSCLLNGAVLDPLFLYKTTLHVKGAAVATVLADSIPTICLITCYFSGVFSVKPKINQLLKPISKRTLVALKVGVSAFISFLSMCIPGIFFTYFIGKSSFTNDDYNNAMAACSISIRFAMFVMSVIMAVNSGYLPSASYAFASKNPKRWGLLTIHASWICFVWSFILAILSFSCPRPLSSLFSSDENVKSISAQMIRIQNALGIVTWVKNIAQSILQSIQCGIKAAILALITQLVSIILFEVILYYTDRHNPVRLMWAYPLSYAFGFILGITFVFIPLKNAYKEYKKEIITNKSNEMNTP